MLHAFSFVAGRCSLRHGLGSAQAPKCNKEEMSETVPQICLDALSPSIEHTQRFQCTELVGVVVLTEQLRAPARNFRHASPYSLSESFVAELARMTEALYFSIGMRELAKMTADLLRMYVRR